MRARPPRPRAWAPLLLALLVAGRAHAQTVRGTVRDDVSDGPVEGAAVLLTDVHGRVQSATRSAADGAFVLRSTAGDTVRVRVERAGYATTETRPWLLRRASVLELEVRLRPAPVALDTLTVLGQRRSRNRAGFERRRRSEVWGRFADAEKLSWTRSPRAIDRLRAVVPGLVAAPDGTVRVRSRGVGVTGVPTCQPRIYVDGMRHPGDVSLDALVSGTALRAVEYYDDPMQAPAQFTMGWDPMWNVLPDGSGGMAPRYGLGRPCAILVLWTDYGFGEAGG